jgi:hypothetical protein
MEKKLLDGLVAVYTFFCKKTHIIGDKPIYMSQAIEEIRHFRKCLGNCGNSGIA